MHTHAITGLCMHSSMPLSCNIQQSILPYSSIFSKFILCRESHLPTLAKRQGVSMTFYKKISGYSPNTDSFSVNSADLWISLYWDGIRLHEVSRKRYDGN